MMATAASLRGVRPSLSVFVAPWRHLPPERPRGLLTLALGYAFLTLVLLMACNLFDHGGVDDLMQGVSRNADPDELQRLADAPGVMAGAGPRDRDPAAEHALLACPCAGLLGRPIARAAMFSSVLALWRCRAAMLVYGLGWMGLMMLTGVVLSLLMVLLGGTSLMGLLSMPLALALTSAYYVSLFFTFRDSFGQAE
jgi:hypothetical protein